MAVNAGVTVRGAPGDYDEWAALGNAGWTFADVLPFFRRVETDADFDNQWHGRDGCLPCPRSWWRSGARHGWQKILKYGDLILAQSYLIL